MNRSNHGKLGWFKFAFSFLKPKKNSSVTIRRENTNVDIESVDQSFSISETQNLIKQENRAEVNAQDRPVSKNKIQLVVGFDLGTSCSKVVLRDSQRKNAFAVDFEKYGNKQNTFLLPTQIFYSRDKFDLSEGDQKFTEIKLNLIGNPEDYIIDNVRNIDLAIAYLGLAFQIVRSWLTINKGDIYKYDEIDWQINIGMQAQDFSDKNVVSLMEYVAILGWELSLKSTEMTIDIIRSLTKIITRDNYKKNTYLSIHPENVNAIPEIIAAVVGYSQSRMREDGMYFLIDVGASTVDISMFNLFPNSEHASVYRILWAKCGKFGVINWIKNLPKSEQDKIQSFSQECDCIDPVSGYFQKNGQTYILPSDEFRSGLNELIAGVINKVKGDGRSGINPQAPEWRQGVPVFITGGGYNIEYYRNAVEKKFIDLECKGISRPYYKDLPTPKKDELEIDSQAPDNIRRFLSAFGLSRPVEEIGEIRGASSIDKIWMIDNEIKPISRDDGEPG